MADYFDRLSPLHLRITNEFVNRLPVHQSYFSYFAEEYCASEIEKLFLCAYGMELYRRELEYGPFGPSTVVLINPDERENIFDKKCSRSYSETNFIQPQFRVGRYRADFAVARVTLHGMKDETPATSPRLLVECDGHDFHERTKEQVRNDNERTRFLQSEGFLILRFSGSEIWADPGKCAEDTNLFLDAKIHELFSTLVDTARSQNA